MKKKRKGYEHNPGMVIKNRKIHKYIYKMFQPMFVECYRSFFKSCKIKNERKKKRTYTYGILQPARDIKIERTFESGMNGGAGMN